MSNTFGTIFRITTWGESHGKAIGVVIDGCPAGLELSEEDIQHELLARAPGKTYTSPRAEKDKAQIFSGVFEGKTTGTPISILIFNTDADPNAYQPISHLLRPGHANFTYLEKYGIFDFRGGGRASARETACRVAAGAIAKQILRAQGIALFAYVAEIAGIASTRPDWNCHEQLQRDIRLNPVFCPDPHAAQRMMQTINEIKNAGDSVGGIIECVALFLPSGLGDPVYEKLEAKLANAMLSIPAAKGFEIGSGFQAAEMKGSEHNDLFYLDEQQKVRTKSNHAGGTLGGISTGMPLVFRVAFKPPSSIRKAQETLSIEKESSLLTFPEGSRHDPCVAIRAVPVVEAMAALVLADVLLGSRLSRF
jgi:chorismate synthase